MADQDNTRQNVVKLPTAAGGKSLIPAKPNISALARQYGVSRQTMRRRLANGWQPGDTPSIEILSPPQRVATLAKDADRTGAPQAASPRDWSLPDAVLPSPRPASAPTHGSGGA